MKAYAVKVQNISMQNKRYETMHVVITGNVLISRFQVYVSPPDHTGHPHDT